MFFAALISLSCFVLQKVHIQSLTFRSFTFVFLYPQLKHRCHTMSLYLAVRHVDNSSNFNFALDLSSYDRDIEYMLNINVSTHYISGSIMP